MATLEMINWAMPVYVEARQHDQAEPMIRSLESVERIKLEGVEANTFSKCASVAWRSNIEADLQCLCADDIGELLSSFVPLVTFREDMCRRSAARQDMAAQALTDKLTCLTSGWRDAGADLVCISGYSR